MFACAMSGSLEVSLHTGWGSQRRAPAQDATIGRLVVETIDAMYKSAKDGSVVKI